MSLSRIDLSPAIGPAHDYDWCRYMPKHHPSNEPLFAEAVSTLRKILEGHGFVESRVSPPRPHHMGAWYWEMTTPEFVVSASQDRTGETVEVQVGSRVRKRYRAHLRGPWSLAHLRGFLDGIPDHYRFESVTEKYTWLRDNLDRLLDASLLNSDELNAWAVKESRRMFGQDRN